MPERSKAETLGVGLMGVGRMGSALARALATAGHDVWIWNRNPARCDPLRHICTVASDPVEICRSTELVLTCFENYGATYEVLDTEGVRTALAGKTLVQMSTATAEQARDFGRWAARHSIAYLDAKIAVTPAQIGKPDCVILYAGLRTVFDEFAPTLRCLAGRTTFMGERIEAAALGDFAFLSLYFAGTIGVLHGAALSQACGLDVGQFFSLVPSYLAEVAARSTSFEPMALKGEYDDVQSALKTDLAAAVLLGAVADQARMSDLFPASLIGMMRDAVERGNGERDSAALIECFLKPRAAGAA